MSRILIVDDAAASREAMSRLLRLRGYETTCARNGAEGMAALKTNRHDLVLLDHMMPEVDGLTFLAGMRRFPKYRNVPVIMWTAISDNANRMKAEALGVKEYLIKAQLSIEDLLGRIQSHVPTTSN